MEVSARSAGPADAVEVAALVAAARTAVVGERGGDQWLATDAPAVPGAAELAAGAERAWFVGCIDGVPVGVAALRPVRWADGRLVLRIDVVFVEPGARDVGVGEAIVDALLDAARAAGADALEGVALPGQRELKNLYERVGLVARAIVTHKRVEPA